MLVFGYPPAQGAQGEGGAVGTATAADVLSSVTLSTVTALKEGIW